MPLLSQARDLFVRDIEKWVQYQALSPDGVVWVTRGYWATDNVGPAVEIVTVAKRQDASLSEQIRTAACYLNSNKPCMIHRDHFDTNIRVEIHSPMRALTEPPTRPEPGPGAPL